MRRVVTATVIVLVISYIIYNIKYIVGIVLPQLEIPDNIAIAMRAIAVALGIVWITFTIASTIRERLMPTMGRKVYGISSLIKIAGYLLAALAVISIAGADVSGLLAGGVVTGLVLGIALQPVLSNFFAGILVMTTRMIEIGDRARILTGAIPYFVALLPAYKHFSVDHLEPGLKGTITDINFFYTTLVTDEGREIKIPNAIFMNSAIVDYTPQFSRREVINVRVELPLASINLENLEEMVREALNGFQIEAGPYLNEQSDKDYVIVLVRIAVPVGQDWKRLKSEALKRLLMLRRRILEAAQIQQRAV